MIRSPPGHALFLPSSSVPLVPSTDKSTPISKNYAYKTTSRHWLNPCLVSARVTTCLTCLMRLFHGLPILSFLFGAGVSSLDSRAPNAPALDARDVLDICAYIDQQLDVMSWYITVSAGVISQSNVPSLNRFLWVPYCNDFDRNLSLSIGRPPVRGVQSSRSICY